MNIPWMYLDKNNASIEALKDYRSMKSIISNTKAEIEAVRTGMIGLGSHSLSDLPKGTRDSAANENRIIRGMEEIDALKVRYQQAAAYMEWFQPAWSALAEDERVVLKLFYLQEDTNRIDAVMEICDHFCIERSSAYKKKDRALSHLSLLLYGK